MEFLNPDGYVDLFSPIQGEINPFIAFKLGPGNRSYPPLTVIYANIQIYNPTFPQFSPFTYVLEASWPDNCKEPCELLFSSIGGNLYSDGSNAAFLRMVARDWQEDISSVAVDLGPIGGGIVELQPDINPNVWSGFIGAAPSTVI